MRAIRLLVSLLLLISLMFLNCRKNDINFPAASFAKAKKADLTDVNKPMNVSLAKLYYKMLTKEYGNKVNNMGGDNRPNRKYVYWKKAITSENSRYSFVEMPLLYNRKATVVKKDRGSVQNKAEEDKIAKASFDRLVIYKNKKNANLNQRIVTYTPDIDYLERHNNDISHNQINKIDKDYSGRIEFKRWDGKLLFTFKYKDGKLLGRYLPKMANSGQRLSRTTDECWETTTYYYWETCYYADPEGLTEWCEYDVYDISYEIECYSDYGDPEDYDSGCDCYYTIETIEPPSVTNNVDDPCISSSIQTLGEGLPNLISALWATTYTGTYNTRDLVLVENTTTWPDDIAWSDRDATTDYIYFNSDFFDTHLYGSTNVTATQEFWASVLAHELVHRFIENRGGATTTELEDHVTIVMSWVGAIASFLQQGYNVPLADARALALGGVGDVLMDAYGNPVASWNTFLQSHYGLSTNDLDTLIDPYLTGAKGSACP